MRASTSSLSKSGGRHLHHEAYPAGEVCSPRRWRGEIGDEAGAKLSNRAFDCLKDGDYANNPTVLTRVAPCGDIDAPVALLCRDVIQSG
jgi:hypothetical protein